MTVGGRTRADIGMDNGQIVQMGSTMSAAREIDATGNFITAGGVDPHVHLIVPPRLTYAVRWADDFESGTRAAVAKQSLKETML